MGVYPTTYWNCMKCDTVLNKKKIKEYLTESQIKEQLLQFNYIVTSRPFTSNIGYLDVLYKGNNEEAAKKVWWGESVKGNWLYWEDFRADSKFTDSVGLINYSIIFLPVDLRYGAEVFLNTLKRIKEDAIALWEQLMEEGRNHYYLFNPNE